MKPIPCTTLPPRPAPREPVHCSNCEAVCCRLTVVLMPDDDVPAWLVQEDAHGPDTMARLDDGWCAALDRGTLQCTIYDRRPQVCRSFRMGGAYCRDERRAWSEGRRRGAPGDATAVSPRS